jgi:hypothetical protein
VSQRLLGAVLLAAAAVALVPAAAAAQTESPRTGSFEIGAGPYRPNIDAEFPKTPTEPEGPYQTVFGDARHWALRVGYAKILYTGNFGSLELGLRTGWFRASGHGLLLDASGNPSSTASKDKTTFSILPTSLTLGYRFDRFLERWSVPLAPYGKVALERYNWWVTDGSGHSVMRGATNGWSMTGGIAFLLDAIDPALAREMDADSGVNDTYLYFDVTKLRVDDFGSKKSWNLSEANLTLSGGLLMVF